MAPAPERPSMPNWLVLVGGLILALLLFRVFATVLRTVFLIGRLAFAALIVVAVGVLVSKRRR